MERVGIMHQCMHLRDLSFIQHDPTYSCCSTCWLIPLYFLNMFDSFLKLIYDTPPLLNLVLKCLVLLLKLLFPFFSKIIVFLLSCIMVVSLTSNTWVFKNKLVHNIASVLLILLYFSSYILISLPFSPLSLSFQYQS